jgi:hypothetical protein
MRLRHGFGAVILGAVSLPVAAGDINNIGGLNQDQFHRFTEDLGAILSYKPLTPTAPLGLLGFDIGAAATATKVKNNDVFQVVGAGDVTTAVLPSLRANLGLPLGFDVGAMVGGVPGTNVRLVGGELRWSFVSGNTVMPAIGLRGSYTQLGGVDQLDFNTRGVDLSISKGFAMFTPYAGIGKVWVTSTPKDIPTATPAKESLSLNKAFVGLNMNFVFVNIALEADKTGEDTSYGLKLGFRF